MARNVKVISVSMPKHLALESRIAAAKQNLSRSAYISRLVEQALQAQSEVGQGRQRAGQKGRVSDG